jgi:hypothetical protein
MEGAHCMASIGDNFDLNDLVDFEEKGKYSNSEFELKHTVGPTTL